MTTRYRIICPECKTEIPLTDPPPVICPACKKPIPDDAEVLFRPAERKKIPRTIALIILLALAAVIILALLSVYR